MLAYFKFLTSVHLPQMTDKGKKIDPLVIDKLTN